MVHDYGEQVGSVHSRKEAAVSSHIEYESSDERLTRGDSASEATLLEQFILEHTALLNDVVKKLQDIDGEIAAQRRDHTTTRGLLEEVAHHVRRVERIADPLRLRQRFTSRLFHLHQYSPQRIDIPIYYAQTRGPANPPLISLVTPSYNQAAFLPHTIASVVDQNYPRLEYFVQDGASKDGSVDVLQRFAPRLTDWESAPDDGQANAINRGFARTSGSIMGWLNSDDLLLPGALAYVANYFEQHPEVDVVYGSRYIVDAKGREIGRWLLPPHDDTLLRWVDYVPQETLFWRRDLWERTGGTIDESFDFALDWDLLLRFQTAGARFACLPRFLGIFRVTENTKTSQKFATVGQDEIDRLRERTLGFVPSPNEVHKQCTRYLRRHNWRRLLNRLGIMRY